jgi:hypothetical protein
MATFAGYRLTEINTAVSPERAPFLGFIESAIFPSAIQPEVEFIGPGDRSIGTIPFISKTVTGYYEGSYVEDFYNRILIEPIFINFGSVLSTQESTIKVFNGYLTNRTLDNITLNNFDDNTFFIGDTPPDTYLPLEERTHIIQILPAGPPGIDASIDYDFEGTQDDITVAFTGTRIILLQFTFRPNLREKLLWSTDIMIARDGTEQRVRNRDAPRQQFLFQAYANKNDRNLVENLLYGRRGLQAALPVWTENRAGESITAGDTTINVSTLYGDFRVGSLALVWESSRKFHAFQIESLTDTTLTAPQAIPEDFASPLIMPIRTIRFLNDPTRNATGYDAVLSAAVEVTDNIKLDTSASAIQFNGEDFYDEEPLMISSDGVRDRYNTKVDLIDYTTGLVEQVVPWEYNRVTRQFRLVLEGLEDIWNFRLWLHRRSGRLVPFYMPTFENNLFIQDRGTLTDILTCQNDLYTSQASTRDKLAFRKTDGSWVFRTVLSSEVDEFGNDIITLDSALDFDYSELEFVSIMGLKRLSSDTFEMTWLSNNVAVVSVPITEISS